LLALTRATWGLASFIAAASWTSSKSGEVISAVIQRSSTVTEVGVARGGQRRGEAFGHPVANGGRQVDLVGEVAGHGAGASSAAAAISATVVAS